jgi:hypothetical protein
VPLPVERVLDRREAPPHSNPSVEQIRSDCVPRREQFPHRFCREIEHPEDILPRECRVFSRHVPDELRVIVGPHGARLGIVRAFGVLSAELRLAYEVCDCIVRFHVTVSFYRSVTGGRERRTCIPDRSPWTASCAHIDNIAHCAFFLY